MHTKELKADLLKRYLHTHVLSSIIHNSQDMEATQDKWMDKQNAVYLHTGILCSFEKEERSDNCYTMMNLRMFRKVREVTKTHK